MKNIKYIFLFTVLSAITSACSIKGDLTKDEALSLLKQQEIDKPLQYTRGMYYGQSKFRHSNLNQFKEIDKLKKLETEGLINLTLVSNETKNYGSKTETFSTYNVSLKPEHEKYVLKKRSNGVTVILLTIKAKSIINIDYENSKFAKVTVEFEKIKTPFYKDEFFIKSSLKDKGDVYTQEVLFRKDNANKWKITNQ